MMNLRLSMVLPLIFAMSLLSACGSSSTAVESVAETVQSLAAESEGSTAAADSSVLATDSAMATVSARSLRVRAAPSSDADVVTGIKEGEQYPVLSLSSDGEWVQLGIPKAPGGKGWVSTNFVTVEGSITDAGVTEVKPSAPKKPVTLPVATPEPGLAVVNIEAARLRVRAEPNADAKIVGYVFDGESFPIRERAADGKWVEIGGRAGTDNPDGGWVAAEFLVVGQ